MPAQAPEPIVAFYLIQETDLPVKFQGEYQIVKVKIHSTSGRLVTKPALRVTFSHFQSIEEPVGLVAFGSDPRCHILLPADIIGSVHCKLWAQLNSGLQIWLVDDTSAQGTKVQDDETSRNQVLNIVPGRRQAAQELRKISVGPYLFRIQAPFSIAEVRRRDDWFHLNKPIPVTHVRRVTGRIRKIKAGVVDMGKGLWQFYRGLATTTCNITCLTAEGVLMLHDIARGRNEAPEAALRLNEDERRLLVDLRAHSRRHEAERQRLAIG
ncbi:hypothetical protein IMSHALPRED_002242 [Imshaugia aleurites]|uniref:FHA domain-containing protein n=1 Tax=Imshaugia aleurites TaxID=172621 RepID=A0A8H3J577_9LECA|nr:hypothetical protein IMSHALPRED_002242 [Imshaugia aleurites]